MPPINKKKIHEISLPHRDIGILASAFDIFWPQYVTDNFNRPTSFEGPEHLISVYRDSRTEYNQNFIDYIIRCSWLTESDLTLVGGAMRALIRFQITGNNSQKINFFVTTPEGLIDPELSEEDTKRIFDSFIDFLQEEEYYNPEKAGGRDRPEVSDTGTKSKSDEPIIYNYHFPVFEMTNAEK